MLTIKEIKLSDYPIPKACVNCSNSILWKQIENENKPWCNLFDQLINCIYTSCGRVRALQRYYKDDQFYN